MNSSPAELNGGQNRRDEINLLDLLIMLLKHKRMILYVVFAGVLITAFSGFILIKNKPSVYLRADTYYSTALIAAADIEFKLLRQSVEHPRFLGPLINNTNIRQLLYAELWDEKNGKWTQEPPSVINVISKLNSALDIGTDPDKLMLYLTFYSKTPEVAQSVLRLYVDNLDKFLLSYTRNQLDGILESKKIYAQENTGARNPELQKEKAKALAYILSREQQLRAMRVPFIVIDYPSTPKKYVAPAPDYRSVLVYAAIGFFLFLLFAVCLAMAYEYFKYLSTNSPQKTEQIIELAKSK